MPTLLLAASLFLLALAPSAAGAETRTFLRTGQLVAAGGNPIFGPATLYPSRITVAGVPGKVTKVTATMLGFSSGIPDDIDLGLRGPNGTTVMLMSDACGTTNFPPRSWSFEDTAPINLPDNGSCVALSGPFMPSNYENPELDDLVQGRGGPQPPYLNKLAFLAGGPPDGNWDLFITDDDISAIGFEAEGWALTLEIEPPPPPVVLVPAPAAPVLPVAAQKTGKRAAALARCKKKATKKARVKCRVKARKLPV